MFTHIMVGSNDMERSRRFYDSALTELGIAKSDPKMPVAIYSQNGGTFIVTKPIDGKSATHANGGTIGFQATSRKAVDAFHKAALAAGGKCEGPPGPRNFAPNAYCAYVRDPDGNKLVATTYNQ
jgi:catechol 2,3-dioxygenase-like lactoylglutathione lyase family enzyme